MKHIRIHDEIFAAFPHYRRGLVVATGLHNVGQASELEHLLSVTIEDTKTRPLDLAEDHRFTSWDQAHRTFGSNPNKYPPAHKALRKRAQRPGGQIPFINKAVAIMSYGSIIGCLPVGGDDLEKMSNQLEIRRTQSEDRFIPLGQPEKIEAPEPNEVVYASPNGAVMCRRWNWRNSHGSAISEQSTSILMNIDGISQDDEQRVLAIRDQIAEMLSKYCAAQVETYWLHPGRSSLTLDPSRAQARGREVA